MPITQWFKRLIFGYDIFISYSRRDSLDYAYKIANHFIDKGYECYIDQLSNINPGQKLPDNIRYAVKRSSSFVFVGSEGAQKSIPIKEEIDLFLHHNRNKPIIPITIEGSINDNAIWYPSIAGLALVEESSDNLKAGEPSDDVLHRIGNALNFTKKAVRLRRITGITIAGVLLITGVMAIISYKLSEQAEAARIETIKAEANLHTAVINETKAKENAEKANDSLNVSRLKLNAIQDDLKNTQANLSNTAIQLNATKEQVTIAQKEVEKEARMANARSLATRAKEAIEKAPQEALILAAQAMRTTKQDGYIDPYAESVFREILSQTGGFSLYGHTDSIISIAFNNTESLAATGSQDGTCRIWDIKDPYNIKCTHILDAKKHLGKQSFLIESIAFSPNSKKVISFISIDALEHNVLLWDISTNIKYPDPEILAPAPNAYTVSPDGFTVAFGFYDGSIRLFDFNNINLSNPLDTLQSRISEYISMLTFSRDNTLLAIGTSNAKISVLHIKHPEKYELISNSAYYDSTMEQKINSPINVLNFSDDNKWLLTATLDQNVALWKKDSINIRSYKPIYLENVKDSRSTQKDLVANICDSVGLIMQWNLLNQNILSSLQMHTKNKGSIIGSPNLEATPAQYLIAAEINNQSAAAPALLAKNIKGHDTPLSAIRESPQRQWFISGSRDGLGKLWPLNNNGHKEPVITGTGSDPYSFIRVSSALNYAALLKQDYLELWNIENIGSPRLLKTIRLSETSYNEPDATINFSPDGSWLTFYKADSVDRDIMTVFNMKTLSFTEKTFSLDAYFINAKSASIFSPDSKYMLAREATGYVLHDLASADPIAGSKPITDEDSGLSDFTFSPDSKWISSKTEINNIYKTYDTYGRLWHVDFLKDTSNYYDINVKIGPIEKLSFSKDGKWLAFTNIKRIKSSKYYAGVNLLRLSLSKMADMEVIPLIGTDFFIQRLQFSPSGKWLLTSSSEDRYSGDNLRVHNLWEMDKIKQHVKPGISLNIDDGGYNMSAFSVTEKYFAVYSGNTSEVSLWQLDHPSTKPSHTLKCPAFGSNTVANLVFSEDNSFLALIDYADYTPYIWNLRPQLFTTEGIPLKKLSLGTSKITFSHDSRSLIISDADTWEFNSGPPVSDLNLYDLTTFPKLRAPREIRTSDRFTDINISKDNTHIITSGNDIKAWQLSIDSLLNYATAIAGRNLTISEWALHNNSKYEKTFEKYPVHYSQINKLYQSLKAMGYTGNHPQRLDLLKNLNKLAIETQEADVCNEVARQSVINASSLALETAEVAISLDPSNGAYKDTRAVALVYKGLYQDAIKDFQAFNIWAADKRYQMFKIPKRKKWINQLQENKNPFKYEMPPDE